jgi:hypothetical protein
MELCAFPCGGVEVCAIKFCDVATTLGNLNISFDVIEYNTLPLFIITISL